MKKQKNLILLMIGLFVIIILLFIIYLKYDSKNIIDYDQEKTEMEDVFKEYISARNARDIDKSLGFLYFKPEYEDHIDAYIDDMKSFHPDIQNFKINSITQINKYLCQLNSVYYDAVREEMIIWEPYIAKIKGEFKIILNSRNIPYKYIINTNITTRDELQ